MPAQRIVASGLTMPLPAMSGAEPCTGSNMDGKRRVGSRFALAARPMLPTRMAERSLRMSPNRFEPTTTSKLSGRRTKFMAAASTSSDSVSMAGNSAATSWKTRSHSTMLNPWAFDLVIEVTLLLAIALDGQFEGEAHDPLDAVPGEDRRLDGHFVGCGVIDEAADLRVLALGVLAHDDHVDRRLARPAQRGSRRPR